MGAWVVWPLHSSIRDFVSSYRGATLFMAKRKRMTKSSKRKRNPAKTAPAKMVKTSSTGSMRKDTQNRIRATFTGTRVFDRTLHKTNLWLKELMDEMNWNNRERAYSALRATLHTLRDILPMNEVIQLGAQLPILLR